MVMKINFRRFETILLWNQYKRQLNGLISIGVVDLLVLNRDFESSSTCILSQEMIFKQTAKRLEKMRKVEEYM